MSGRVNTQNFAYKYDFWFLLIWYLTSAAIVLKLNNKYLKFFFITFDLSLNKNKINFLSVSGNIMGIPKNLGNLKNF